MISFGNDIFMDKTIYYSYIYYIHRKNVQNIYFEMHDTKLKIKFVIFQKTFYFIIIKKINKAFGTLS